MDEHPRDNDACERRRALRKVRDSIRPPADFDATLTRALIAAEAAPRPIKRRNSVRALWRQAPLMLPAALGVMLALYATLDTPAFDEMNVAEHSLEIPLAGQASVDLALALHHHGDDWTDVAVHAPRGVSVSTRSRGNAAPAACQGNRCRYEFTHRADQGSPEMRAHVTKPGRYRMEIEHQSRNARVREVFVIHALR